MTVIIVGKIAFYAADAPVFIQEFVVDIVPVLTVVGEERIKVRLVFDDKAGDSQRGELVAAEVDELIGSAERYLYPVLAGS